MRALPALLLVASLTFADGADPVTAQIPADARVFYRLPSLDRIDAIAGELRPLLQLFAGEGKLPEFGKVAASEHLRRKLGLTADMVVDRTKPIYLVVSDNQPVFFLAAAPETRWEGERALLHGQVAVLRDRVMCIGRKQQLAAAARGTPTEMAQGDVAIHVFLGELIEQHKDVVKGGIKDALETLKGLLPAKGHGLVDQLARAGDEVLQGVESLDYAMHLKEGRLESTGWIKTRPRSALRTYLAGMGPPRDNDLIALLPDSFFLATDSVWAPSFLYRDLAAMLDKALGEGASGVLVSVLGPLAFCGEHMTGRSAGSMRLIGLGGNSTFEIYELKDAEKAKAALRAVDADGIRKRIEELGLPLAFQYEVATGKHGETELHRMNVRFTEMPFPMMMFSSSQSYLAVEGNYLLVATATTAEADLKKLIDSVRKGERNAKHAHLEAMQRLGKERNIGLTINLGALKPLFMMFAMAEPDFARVMKAVPDKMLLSTAVSLKEDGIWWRGDWPLKEVGEITRAVYEVMREKELEKELEEDFD